MADILNSHWVGNDIPEELRAVCEDYFFRQSDSDSDESLIDDNGSLAERLDPQTEERTEEIDINAIPLLQVT